MAGAAELTAYKELVLVLATAAVVVPAVVRLGLNPIFGFLVTGAILGPDGIGRLAQDIPWLAHIAVTDRTQIAHLAEAGVVFLLFMIGLELSFERLWTMRRLVFLLGAAQVMLTGALLTAGLRLLGIQDGVALILGFAFALSSTALVVQILADKKRLGSATGRTVFAILLFQDIAAVPLLVLVGVLAQPGSGGLWQVFGLVSLKAVIAVGAIMLVGRYLLRPLFRAAARTRSSELFMAASLLVVIGTGLVTAASGLSMALGAFIAGLILAETEFRREIEATIEPFKGLLIGVFFFSVGMSIDAQTIMTRPWFIIGAVALLITFKGGIVYALARLARTGRGVAAETALLGATAGEFTLVVVGLAAAGKLIAEPLAGLCVAIAAISMFLTPLLAAAGQRLKNRLQPAPQRAAAVEAMPPTARDEHPDVIVAGYGRVGDLVCRMLAEHKLSYLAVDSNPDLVAWGRKAGHPVFFGDASDIDMLTRCGLEGAKVLIVTMDNRKAVLDVATAARRLHGDGLAIVARARDADHAAQLYAAGVTEAVPEAIEASLHMSEAALISAGVPLGLAIAAIHEQRDQSRAAYQKIAPAERDPVARLRTRRSALRKGEGEAAGLKSSDSV
ncbi:MAG: cation:proton antiporter [Beijerinckiaceae bacterium]